MQINLSLTEFKELCKSIQKRPKKLFKMMRQLGGFAYQGLSDEMGHYDDDYAWWGLLAMMEIQDGYVRSIEFVPLKLDEGTEYRADYDKKDFLTRRGFSEIIMPAFMPSRNLEHSNAPWKSTKT